MKQVSKMPTGGQFVAVWLWNGAPWSAAYKWESGCLKIYSTFDDEWEKVKHPTSLKSHLNISNSQYFIAD